jgi:hypothetical protein
MKTIIIYQGGRCQSPACNKVEQDDGPTCARKPANGKSRECPNYIATGGAVKSANTSHAAYLRLASSLLSKPENRKSNKPDQHYSHTFTLSLLTRDVIYGATIFQICLPVISGRSKWKIDFKLARHLPT